MKPGLPCGVLRDLRGLRHSVGDICLKINIASWTAHQGGRDMVLYTTAKTALAGFTRA
jgi:hypothetical protein